MKNMGLKEPVFQKSQMADCFQEGSLIISQVKAEDGGVYVCEITNGIGGPQRAQAALAVECKYIAEVLKRNNRYWWAATGTSSTSCGM
jgi:Immunoglobulin I-set domain